MKNLMFQHLLDKFTAYQPQGGRENPENTWFYDITDALEEVRNIVASTQNADKDTFAERAASVKKAFADLKKASDAMFIKGRGSFPKEVQPLYTALAAVQKPLDFYIKGLDDGKTLNAVFSDAGWITGLFNATEPVDNKNYKKGSYKLGEKTTYKEILDTYKQDAKDANIALDSFLKDLSGDNVDPDGMIQEKFALIQEYIDSYDHIEDTKEEGKDFRADINMLIGWAYTQIRDRFNVKNIHDLGAPEFIMSEDFFTHQMDLLSDRTQILGDIERMGSLSKETIKIIEDELNKPRLKYARMGFTQELVDRSDKIAFVLQGFKNAIEPIRMNYGEAIENDLPREITEKIDAVLNNTAAYIRGEEGVIAPDDKDIVDITKAFADLAEQLVLINSDGSVEQYTDLCAMFVKMVSELTPAIKTQLESVVKNLDTTLKTDILNVQEKLRDPRTTQEVRENIEAAVNELRGDALIDRDFEFKLIYSRMARDPEYNRQMIAKAEEIMGVYAAAHVEKGRFPTDARFGLRNMRAGETFPKERVYKDAYTMYLIGKQFEVEREKKTRFEARGAAPADKLRNAPNKNLRKIMDAKVTDAGYLAALDNAVNEIQETALFKQIEQSGPVVFNSVINNAIVAEELVSAMNMPKLDYFGKIKDSAIAALTQKSDTAGIYNSDSYKAVSNALKTIAEKNGTYGGATQKDYMNLYSACKNYVVSHDTDAATPNGRLRQDAAMSVMYTVGNLLAKDDPEFAPAFSEDNYINMTRSKTYRIVAGQLASSEIRKAIGRYSGKYSKGFDALPENVKKTIFDNYATVAVARGLDEVLQDAPGNQISGKLSKQQVFEKVQSTLAASVSAAGDLFDRLEADPKEALKEFEPQKVKVIRDRQLEAPVVGQPELH